MLTSELAEDIGWLIGDGCITKKNWFKMAGDPIEEKLFYDEIVVPSELPAAKAAGVHDG